MGERARQGREQALTEETDLEVEDCEWCQNYEASGLYDLDDAETGLCWLCAENNGVGDCE
ncbi:hypothetical protein P3T27_002090 [Kitasatospora sp. MAA19]|nr:hypothetical protein [Kitasatospora sp. MAA19]